MSKANLIDSIQADVAALAVKLKSQPQTVGLFQVQTANQCLDDAKDTPIPEKLFLSLMYEGEVTILVADTNVGKSIFAVQMGESIARNGHKVIYVDLELSLKQFERRYSNDFENHYTFSDNFFRVYFATPFSIPKGVTYEDYFIDSIKQLAIQEQVKVFIIDNMTALLTGDTDTAKASIPLMNALKALRNDYGLSLLLLEHTKKVDDTRLISLNDLQGSKMKANLADAVFTIGRSKQSEGMRYIKQLKMRSGEFEYVTDNVMICEIVKENSFLQFREMGYGHEVEHLRQLTPEDRTSRIEQAKELKTKGYSNRDIAKQLGVSEGAVRKWFNRA